MQRDEEINRGEKKALLEVSGEGGRPPGRRTVARKVLRGIGAGLCVALVVGSWAVMAEKLQDLGKTFKQPFFQTYWIHSSYGIMYIVWSIWLYFPGKLACNSSGEGTLTNHRHLFLTACFLALASFVSGLLWYVSLNLTSVAANTAIYQSTSAVVFLMSVPLLRERVTLVKVLSVAFTIIGVCLVSFFSSQGNRHSQDNNHSHSNSTSLFTDTEGAELQSDHQENSTPVGYVCVLISMIIYAAYETVFKKYGTRPDDTAPVWNGIRMIGYVGVHTLMYYWPLLIVVHFMGVETFRFPTLIEFRLLVGMTCLDMVFNASLFVCIALSTPLFAAVGSVLTLPVTVFLDWILKDDVMSWQSFLGVGAIAVGFFMLVFSEYWEMRRRHTSTDDEDQVLQSLYHSRTFTSPSSKSCNSLKQYII